MPTSRPLIPRNKRNASKPDGFRLIQGSGPGFNPGGGRFNPGGDARTPSPGVTGTHKGTGVPGTPEYRPLIPRNKRNASRPDGFGRSPGTDDLKQVDGATKDGIRAHGGDKDLFLL